MEVDADSLKTNSTPEDPRVILEQIEPPKPSTTIPEPEDDLPPGEPMEADLIQVWYNLTGIKVGSNEDNDLKTAPQWMCASGQVTKEITHTRIRKQTNKMLTMPVKAPATPPKPKACQEEDELWAAKAMCIDEAYISRNSITLSCAFTNNQETTMECALLDSGATDNFVDHQMA